MNDFDAENHILRQKEMARRAAESYPLISYLDGDNNDGADGVRLVYRRALAGLGGRLITLGYRLQGEIGQLSATDMPEPLSFSSNGHAG